MKRLMGLLILVLLAGCARLPSAGSSSEGKRIVMSMTLDGEFNPNFVYIFPLRVSTAINPPSPGPIPVIQAPWGNGFVAGNATHFIAYEPQRPLPFVLYEFIPGTDLLSWREIAIIEVFEVHPVDDPNLIQNERRRFRFEVPVNDLAATPALADQLEVVQVNFLTMEARGSGTGQRAWDALGNGALPSEINSWVQVSLRTAAIFDNQRLNFLEPQSPDVADPALDIRDWSIEIRLP